MQYPSLTLTLVRDFTMNLTDAAVTGKIINTSYSDSDGSSDGGGSGDADADAAAVCHSQIAPEINDNNSTILSSSSSALSSSIQERNAVIHEWFHYIESCYYKNTIDSDCRRHPNVEDDTPSVTACDHPCTSVLDDTYKLYNSASNSSIHDPTYDDIAQQIRPLQLNACSSNKNDDQNTNSNQDTKINRLSTVGRTTESAVSSLSTWEQQKAMIRQYIQPRDQIMCFTSLLLKSCAYYYHHSDQYQHRTSSTPPIRTKKHTERCTKQRPIAVLPRTQYNQPYIPIVPSPTSTMSASIAASSSSVSYFSISHQFPIVGLVQIVKDREHQDSQQDPQQPIIETNKTVVPMIALMLVGMDIVIFDAHYNRKWYTNHLDFIQLYQDYFTVSEWDTIVHAATTTTTDKNGNYSSDTSSDDDDDDNMLYEFYIQWSIKEAYTKALGLGMNVNFQSFETDIDTYRTTTVANSDDGSSNSNKNRPATSVDNNKINDNTKQRSIKEPPTQSLWQWIKNSVSSSSAPSGIVSTIGTITQMPLPRSDPIERTTTTHLQLPQSSRPKQEQYYFYFVPLYKNTEPKSNHDNTIMGCATICYGPIHYTTETPPTRPIPNARPSIIKENTVQSSESSPSSVTAGIPDIQIEYTNLHQLIAYHTQS
jgi:phosphopantetheinyl transferase (holo-ACP synthase)